MQEQKKREKVDRITVKYTVLMLVSVFISSISQVLLKKAAMRHYDSVIQEYFNLRVIIGYVLFAATSLLTVLAYRVVPLFMGPVLEATSYIYVTVLGVVFLGEKINVRKLAALGFIVAGVIVCTVCDTG